MQKTDVDIAIIGGGVVGLSCAYTHAKAGRSVLVLERNTRTFQETSTHNSGVIHSGIYYDNGSLKAQLCVEGKKLLLDRLSRWNIPHRICGKLIIASTKNEIPILEQLYRNGLQNNVEDLKPIGKNEIAELEPNILAKAALHSAGTGVFDVGEYLRVLEAKTLAAKAEVITNCKFTGINRDSGKLEIKTKTRGNFTASYLVNAAGLQSAETAKLCGEGGHEIYPCRGEYANVIQKKCDLVRTLVYPAPSKISLGIHLTKTIDGELWVGPSARYIDDPTDYETDRLPLEFFWKAAKIICPDLKKEDLRTGQSGIRPKRYGPGESPVDFHIGFQKSDRRIIHLIGIESPGLTASPAIGQAIAKMIG